MSTSSSDETVKLKFPSAITGPSGRRDKRCNAAWFIEQAYQLNPQKNIVEKKAAVEEGWKMLARANFPLSVQGMMAEVCAHKSSGVHQIV